MLCSLGGICLVYKLRNKRQMKNPAHDSCLLSYSELDVDPSFRKIGKIIIALQSGIVSAAESTVNIVASSENVKHLGQ